MQSPVPVLIFAYTCLLHAGLPIVAAVLFGDKSAPLFGLSADKLVAPGATTGAAAAFYGAGLLAAVAAVLLPPIVAAAQERSAAATPAPSPQPQPAAVTTTTTTTTPDTSDRRIAPKPTPPPRAVTSTSMAALAGNPISRALVPFMIRHTLFEMCTLVGFVFSFMREQPFLVLPFAAVGLLGSLLTPPTRARISG